MDASLTDAVDVMACDWIACVCKDTWYVGRSARGQGKPSRKTERQQEPERSLLPSRRACLLLLLDDFLDDFGFFYEECTENSA